MREAGSACPLWTDPTGASCPSPWWTGPSPTTCAFTVSARGMTGCTAPTYPHLLVVAGLVATVLAFKEVQSP